MIYFFDMDDTLTDFSGRYKEVTGVDCPEKITDEEKKGLFGYYFFRRMEPKWKMLQFVRRLLENGERVYVLSATGYIDENDIKVAKYRWLRSYLPELFEQGVGIDAARFVNKSHEKAPYAYKEFVETGTAEVDDLVLIDDRDKALIPWKEMGGQIIKVGK